VARLGDELECATPQAPAAMLETTVPPWRDVVRSAGLMVE
jgi:hypothetical protein